MELCEIEHYPGPLLMPFPCWKRFHNKELGWAFQRGKLMWNCDKCPNFTSTYRKVPLTALISNALCPNICCTDLAVKARGQSICTGAWKSRAHTSQYVRNKENLWSGAGENCSITSGQIMRRYFSNSKSGRHKWLLTLLYFNALSTLGVRAK